MPQSVIHLPHLTPDDAASLAPDPEALQHDLACATHDALRDLGAPHHPLPPPAFPEPLLHPLRAALGLELGEQAPGWQERAEALRRHYLHLMPRLRVQVLAASPPDAQRLLHTPLHPHHLPRLAAIWDALTSALHAANLRDPIPEVASPWGGSWRDAWDRTCFAGCMPPLYAYPADLSAYTRELPSLNPHHDTRHDTHHDTQRDAYHDAPHLARVIDRRLSAPLLHEWAHLQRHRPAPLPPLLDECIAGYIGVHLHPPFAYPEHPGDDNAIMGAPRFAQIGQALAAAVGFDNLLRAQAGALPWDQALGPDLLRAAQQLGWALHAHHRAPHLLPGADDPSPWLALAWRRLAKDPLDDLHPGDLHALRAAGQDAYLRAPATPLDHRMTLDALRALHLRATCSGASWRVTTTLHPHEPIHLDLQRGLASRGRDTYPLPPAAARAWREGRAAPAATLLLRDLDALPDAAEAILQGRDLTSPLAHLTPAPPWPTQPTCAIPHPGRRPGGPP